MLLTTILYICRYHCLISRWL